MKKEEFLAFSLPYGLKFKDTFRNSINLLTGIKSNDNDLNYEGGVYSHSCYMSWINCTPILHPMSDLTKMIEHNGEKFVPMIRLAEIGIESDIIEDIFPSEHLKCKVVNKPFGKFAKCIKGDKWYIVISLSEPLRASFWIIQKLIEWKFDISFLIDKGEAIDVNTLEINPYK